MLFIYYWLKISKKYFGDHIWSNVEYDYKKIDIVKKNWSDKESKILFTKKEMDYGEELLNNLGLSKFNYVVFGSRNENFSLKNYAILFDHLKNFVFFYILQLFWMNSDSFKKDPSS